MTTNSRPKVSVQFRLLVVLVGLLAPVAADAQLPLGARDLSPSAVSDSQRVLRDLDAVVGSERRNAAAWHRRGMIAWALAIRATTEPRVRGLDATRLRRLADSSLRIAASLESGSALYQLSAGGFLRDAEQPTARLAALRYLENAVEAARAGADSALWARAAVEAGRVHWLQYDVEADRMGPCEGVAPTIDSASTMRRPRDENAWFLPTPQALTRLHNRLRECQPPPRDAGAAPYAHAERLFREAYLSRANDPRSFRHLAMLLAEKGRWEELETVAWGQTRALTADGTAWLALGLARHRGATPDEAGAAFDSALALIGPNERSRLFAFTRVLAQHDSTAYLRSSDESRTSWERSYWTMADPLWSRPGNPVRTEFLARVAFAELRWTVEELGVRGADSDRGSIHIRYGPPDLTAALRGCDFVADPMSCSSGPRLGETYDPLKAALPGRSDVVTYWDYNNGLTVVFWGPPSYGTARYPIVDAGHIAKVIEARPVAFDNVPLETVLELPSGFARFRAAADSVDLFLFAQVPLAELRRDAVANAPLRAEVWLIPRERSDEYHEVVTLAPPASVRWIRRVSPSTYLYRIEATLDGSMVAARAMGWLVAGRDTATGFNSRGFGISDILLAEAVAPRTQVPVRWDDFDTEPLLRVLPMHSSLELIWENYELSSRDGETAYSIAVTIQRERATAGRIGAVILGALAGAAGIERRDDRVTFRFDRIVRPAQAFADHVSLGLADTPAGTYRVTVELTDRGTGGRASATSVFAIRE